MFLSVCSLLPISPPFLQKNHANLGIWFELMEYGRCFNLILISKISKYHHLLLLLFNHLHSFWRCSCFFDEFLPMVSGHMYHWKTNQINFLISPQPPIPPWRGVFVADGGCCARTGAWRPPPALWR